MKNDLNLTLTERIRNFINDQPNYNGNILTDYVSLDEIINLTTKEYIDIQHEEVYVLMIGLLEIINCSQMERVELLMPQFVIPLNELSNYTEAYNLLTEHLYYCSVDDNYFWKGCQFSVYQETFNKRFEQYKELYPDANLLCFIEGEIITYKDESNYIDSNGMGFIEYEPADLIAHGYIRNCYLELENALILSQDRKTEYLWRKKGEIEDLNNSEKIKTHQDNPKKYIATHYCLALILDILSSGQVLPVGQKQYIINRFKPYQSKNSGNTLYKKFNELVNKDFDQLSTLNAITKDWFDLVLKLSLNPDALKKYLTKKNLI